MIAFSLLPMHISDGVIHTCNGDKNYIDDGGDAYSRMPHQYWTQGAVASKFARIAVPKCTWQRAPRVSMSWPRLNSSTHHRANESKATNLEGVCPDQAQSLIQLPLTTWSISWDCSTQVNASRLGSRLSPRLYRTGANWGKSEASLRPSLNECPEIKGGERTGNQSVH